MDAAPRFLLISVTPALPAMRAFLAAHGAGPLGPAEELRAARLLAEAVKAAEALVAYAVLVAGRPSRE